MTKTKMYQGKDAAFHLACANAGVTPTKRQYSKWSNGRGQARGVAKSGRKIDSHGTER